MSIAELKVELRKETGKQSAKAIRRSGRVPGIYYFHNEEPVNVSIDYIELNRLFKKEFNVLKIKMDSTVLNSIIREVQKDPITEKIMHVDFMGIKLDEQVRLNVPILLTGTAFGVREGGILEQLLREVEVEGLPLEIPEHLELDVSKLDIGDTLFLSDLESEKFRFVTDLKQPVAHVQVSRAAVSVGLEDAEGEEEAELSEES